MKEFEKLVNQMYFMTFLVAYIFMLDIPEKILEYVMSHEFDFEKNEKTVSLHHVISMLKGGDLKSNELRRLVILEIS